MLFRSQRQDIFRISHPRASYGIFVQEELPLSPAWTVYLGGRVDETSSDAPFFSPRIALVYTHKSSAYKLLYGRAFRNPSTYERYYDPNPALQAERINTVEFSREQSLRKRLNLITSVFQYRLGDMIQGVPVGDNMLQYQNVSKAVATGLEAELNGHPTNWLETSASFSTQRTRGFDSGDRLQNSPVRLGQFRASVPLAKQRFMMSGAVRYMGSRLAADDSRVAAVALADATVTALRLHPSLDFQVGVRNLLNKAYSDPLSPEHAPLLLLPRTGRTFYVKLTWRNE